MTQIGPPASGTCVAKFPHCSKWDLKDLNEIPMELGIKLGIDRDLSTSNWFLVLNDIPKNCDLWTYLKVETSNVFL